MYTHYAYTLSMITTSSKDINYYDFTMTVTNYDYYYEYHYYYDICIYICIYIYTCLYIYYYYRLATC